MMVACHKYDVEAAKALGFSAAFIPRPLEFGPSGDVDVSSEPYFDIFVASAEDLAERLGA